MPKDFAKYSYYVLLFLAILAAGTVMKVMASVIVPVTLSIILSLVIIPLADFLHNKLKFPWFLAVLVIVAAIFILTYGVCNIVASSLATITESFPKYEDKLKSVYIILAEKFSISYDEELSLFSNLWEHLNFRNQATKFALGMTESVYGFFKTFLTVMLFVVFFMLEAGNTKSKIKNAFEGKLSERVSDITKNIIRQTTQYISIKFLISLATGIVITVVLSILGMEFSIVWGFFAFVMNFIPTFGSIISCTITILFSVVQFYPVVWPIIIVAFTMIMTNFILGNFLEPRIEGDNLNLSPFVILVSLTVWGYIWGFVGMLIAVPLMVILKIICENISFLKPVAIILGNK